VNRGIISDYELVCKLSSSNASAEIIQSASEKIVLRAANSSQFRRSLNLNMKHHF